MLDNPPFQKDKVSPAIETMQDPGWIVIFSKKIDNKENP